LETEGEKLERGLLRIPLGEGSRLWVSGELVAYKVTSDRTAGAYSLFEVASWPGAGPPPHVQHREDEAFWVLDGEYEFLIEGRRTRADAGSLVYVPRGHLHSHVNVGGKPGKLLVILTPGGLHERFFEDIGEPSKDLPAPPVAEGRLGGEAVAGIAARYGIEMVPRALAGSTGGEEPG
jgi:mannose-6-phosphate isomerase-like protein (cupin superfamily)